MCARNPQPLLMAPSVWVTRGEAFVMNPDATACSKQDEIMSQLQVIKESHESLQE